MISKIVQKVTKAFSQKFLVKNMDKILLESRRF